MKRITSIDLFAGAGGMRLGLKNAVHKLGLKHECLFYSEINNWCREVYQNNFPKTKLIADIKSIKPYKIRSVVPGHDILLAGFPCQPFSQAAVSLRNYLNRKHGFEDEREGNLFFNILDIIAAKKPKAFLLENVQNLSTYDNGNVMNVILKSLRKKYYVPDPKILNAQYFGLAQRRRRVYIVGFLEKNDCKFMYPEPDNSKVKVRDFLEKEVDTFYTISDRLWSGHKKRRLRNQKANKGFGYKLTRPKDECTNTITARYYKDGGECLIYQGKNNNPRKLTPRECFNLQGFPKSFKILESKIQSYKQAGNAVPVRVVEKICFNIIHYLLDTKKNRISNLRTG